MYFSVIQCGRSAEFCQFKIDIERNNIFLLRNTKKKVLFIRILQHFENILMTLFLYKYEI